MLINCDRLQYKCNRYYIGYLFINYACSRVSVMKWGVHLDKVAMLAAGPAAEWIPKHGIALHVNKGVVR